MTATSSRYQDDPSYPVGRFDRTAPFTPTDRTPAIEAFAALPAQLRAAVAGLSDAQLDTPYRDGGWTVRQVVHHVADSHMNGLIRLKLALTEDEPTIKPYDENAWSTLADMRLPIEVSLRLVDSVHERWVAVWRSMDDAAFARRFVHPDLGPLTVNVHLQLYAWHGRHHVAHVTRLREARGW